MAAVTGSSAFDAEWLAAQRWFRSKRRAIGRVSEVDRAPVPGTVAALLVLAVSYVDGGQEDEYLVTAVDGREPRDGEGTWRALVDAIAADAELAGSRGAFRCERSDAFADLVGRARSADALEERRLTVEQSNTSIVLGERLILKLYRLLEPGLSPDLELGAFLTEVGFGGTPPLAGWITYRAPGAEPAAAAMLQQLVPTAGDAWAAMLDALASEPATGIARAAQIGHVTAELHRALASRPDHPGFPARAATPEETARWRAAAERQLAEAVSAVDGAAHDRLVALAPPLTARFADTFGAVSGRTAVSRVHGDYHLGQLLWRADGEFSVIDFEGEPARPLADRRAPASPLRDVAGLLRSLDYAARTAEAGLHAAGFEADAWLPDARDAFLAAYGGIGPGEAGLLEAFELEKACYEVRYEANNRPDWLWLPLAAIERLAAR